MSYGSCSYYLTLYQRSPMRIPAEPEYSESGLILGPLSSAVEQNVPHWLLHAITVSLPNQNRTRTLIALCHHASRRREDGPGDRLEFQTDRPRR